MTDNLTTTLLGSRVRVHGQPIGDDIGIIRTVYLNNGTPMYTILVNGGNLIVKSAKDFTIES